MTADRASGVNAAEHRLRALPAGVVELSGDVTAFDARRAVAETRERQDPIYWVDLEVAAEWFVIGDNGQGDEWWLGPRGDVWFFDHTDGERSISRFQAMHLSVTEWIMTGHLLGAFEKIDDPTDDDVARLHAGMEAISAELPSRWPYAPV